jgi:CDP-6-deoxy-D-xylo-4-hexulose-3-dehydrase
MNKNSKIFDNFLRGLVKNSAYLYYKFCNSQKRKQGDYIPVSGKVLDENELFNMIDASLDMWLTTGRFNTTFEAKLAKFLNIKYALTVNSGSSANLLAMTALTSNKLGEKALKKGDEVISVAAGFPTTINPIIQNGLIPVFIDVDIGTYNIKAEQIEEAITPKTKAIFIAHTLGNPFNLDKILELCEKYNLWLIEDNCDALGSRYRDKLTGTFGHIATLSFYPAHHITMGEGGAVLTNDNKLYRTLLSFRDWGRDCWCPSGKDNTCNKRFEGLYGNLPKGYDHKYVYSHLGFNLKITDWQSAIGLAQLDKLPSFIEKRKENFKIFIEQFKFLEELLILPKATENSSPSWFGFPITLKNNPKYKRVDLIKFLEENKIGTRLLFAGNMLRQPAFLNSDVKFRIRNSSLLTAHELTEDHYQLIPNSDTIMTNTFWIGVWPGIEMEDIKYIVSIFEKFFTKN